MFGSKEALAQLRQKSLKEFQEARRQHEMTLRLIDALPPDTPAPEAVRHFGYCAEAGLVFKGAGLEQQLLKLYPPLPLVHVHGHMTTQKPEKYIHADDRSSHIESIYPAVIRHEKGGRSTLRWWTEFAGLDVEIGLYDPKGVVQLNLDPSAYSRHDISYAGGHFTTIFRKRQVQPAHLRKSARQRWKLAWEELCNQHHWRAGQRALVKAIRAHIEENAHRPFTMADLPEPHYLQLGTALAIPEGADLMETIERLRQREIERAGHPFDEIADFWALFTRQDAEELVAFAEVRRQELPAMYAEERRELEAIAQAAREFFATRGCMSDDMHLRDRVTEHLRRVTGLEVNFRGIWGYPNQGIVKLTPYFDPYDAYEDIEVPCVKGAKLRIQDVPAIYVAA